MWKCKWGHVGTVTYIHIWKTCHKTKERSPIDGVKAVEDEVAAWCKVMQEKGITRVLGLMGESELELFGESRPPKAASRVPSRVPDAARVY